ncbi:DDE-type integrase/transposase/recombinase [Kitasatospora sp. NPDC048540]|uniref:DDE-type integrase/transposase/recombinase n=1 Tax=unclassified Kitasatospora TaxID=2633591 RepID=UPI002101A8C8|nr:DDE-type integrase/transposase/recombinase [Kitasatospora sp. MBT63]
MPPSTPAATASPVPAPSVTQTEEGRLHLATVIDIASRRVVGWATADHLRTGLVADALQAACRTRRPDGPVIFHSDRGCQYTSREFAELAVDFDVQTGDWVCAPDEHGRGSLIVMALASDHGVTSQAGHVTHWADLPVAA